LACCPESCLCRSTGPVELARPRRGLVFPPGLHGLPCDTGPRSIALTGSSSQQLLLLFRAHFPLVTRSPAEAGELPPSRSRPPSRHQYQGSTWWQASQVLPWFRPQRFSRSRRFPPPRTLQACFIPLPRPRSHFRGFSRQPAVLARHQPLPSCRYAALACDRVAPFAPAPAAPSSGRCSGCRFVVADRFFRPARDPIPSCVFNPSGFPLHTLEPPSWPLRS
jgi:hypothetical protein